MNRIYKIVSVLFALAAFFACAKVGISVSDDLKTSEPGLLSFTPKLDISFETKVDLVNNYEQFEQAYGDKGFEVKLMYASMDDLTLDMNRFYDASTVKFVDGLWQSEDKLFWHEDADFVLATGFAPAGQEVGLMFPDAVTVQQSYTIPHKLDDQVDVMFGSAVNMAGDENQYSLEMDFFHPQVAIRFKEGNFPDGYYLKSVSLIGAPDRLTVQSTIDESAEPFIIPGWGSDYNVTLTRGVDFGGDTGVLLQDIKIMVAPVYDRTETFTNPFPASMYYEFVISNGETDKTAAVHFKDVYDRDHIDWRCFNIYTYKLNAQFAEAPESATLTSGMDFNSALAAFEGAGGTITSISFEPLSTRTSIVEVQASGSEKIYAVYSDGEVTICSKAKKILANSDMIGMFANLANVCSIDLSSLDTSNATDMTGLFYSCSSLSSVNLASFNTSKVASMSLMFAGTPVTSLDLSGFDTASVTVFSYMFDGCNSLESVNVSSFDTSNAVFMQAMFAACQSLPSLDLSNFDTSSVSNFNSMFVSTTALSNLTLGENFRKVVADPTTDMMFNSSGTNSAVLRCSDGTWADFASDIPGNWSRQTLE